MIILSWFVIIRYTTLCINSIIERYRCTKEEMHMSICIILCVGFDVGLDSYSAT